MPLKKLSFVISIILFTHSILFSMEFRGPEHGVERAPERQAEEIKKQFTEREALENRLKENEREQQRLSELRKAPESKPEIPERLDQIKKSNEQIKEDITKVDTRIVNLEVDKRQGEITIPVAERPEAEKPSGKPAPSVEAWESEWNKLSQQKRLGGLWGSTGYLFDNNISIFERVNKIKQMVDSLPEAAYKNFADAEKAITNLEKIASVAEKLVDPDDPNGVSIRKALQNKATDLIAKGDFANPIVAAPTIGMPLEEYTTRGPQSEQINGLADIYKKVSTSAFGDEAFKNTIENLIANRMSREISHAGPEELQAIKEVLKNQIGEGTDLQKKLTSFIDREEVIKFKQDFAKRGETYSLAKAAEALLKNVTDHRSLAEAAIIEEFTKEINSRLKSISAEKPLEEHITDMVNDYVNLLKHMPSDQTQVKLKNVIIHGLEEFIREAALPENISESIDTLSQIAQTLTNKLPAKDRPSLVKIITNQVQSLVANEVKNHTLITDALKTAPASALSEEAYKAYNKEFSLLQKYQDIVNAYGEKQFDPDIAKRAVLLKNFIEARESLLKEKPWWKGLSKLMTRTEPLVKFIQQNDAYKPFWDAQQQIKTAYGNPELFALPEDIVATIAKTRMSQLDAHTELSPERKTAYDELVKVRDLMQDPATAEAFKDVADTSKTLETINELLSKKNQEDLSRFKSINDESKNVSRDIQEATSFESPEELKARVEKLASDLDAFAEHSTLSETKLLEVVNTRRELAAWTDVIDLASSYQKMSRADATPEQAHETLQTIQKKLPSILNELNYKTHENFKDRLTVMASQASTLAKVNDIFGKTQVTVEGKALTLPELSKILSDFFYNRTLPSAQEWKALKENGLVASEPREVVIKADPLKPAETITQNLDFVTDKGQTILEIAKQHEDISRRNAQLEQFIKVNKTGAAPDLSAFNASGREIGLAKILKLAWLIPDDEITVLKDVYNTYYVKSDINTAMADLLDATKLTTPAEAKSQEAQKKNLEEFARSKNLVVTDIGDYLELVRTMSEKAKPEFKASDPYFEALITQELRLQDPNMSEAQRTAIREKMALEGTLLKISALSDPEALAKVTRVGLIADTKEIFKEVGDYLGEGYTAFALTLREWKVGFQKKGAKALWWSIIPGTLIGYFGVRLAGAAAPAAGAAVAGPVGSALVGFVANTYITNIIAIGVAVTTGIGLTYAAYKTEKISQENAQKLFEDSAKAGYIPKEIRQDKWWWQKALNGGMNLFRSTTTLELKKAEEYKNILNQKEKTFEMARSQLFELLGLTSEATDVDFKNALRLKKSELDQYSMINRWLKGRKVVNAYDFMLATGKDMAASHETYNAILTGAVIAQMGKISENNQGLLMSFLSKAGEKGTSLLSKLRGPAEQKLSQEDFLAVARELIQTNQNNIRDLEAFKEIVDTNRATINRSTLFGDETFTDTAKLLINRQQQIVSQAFQENVNALMKGYGYESVQVPRAKLSPGEKPPAKAA